MDIHCHRCNTCCNMDILFCEKKKMKLSFAIFILASLFCFASCTSGPQPINYGKDACDFCKMNIVDPQFAAQCLNTKGKSFHFDDVHCMVSFLEQGNLTKDNLGD